MTTDVSSPPAVTLTPERARVLRANLLREIATAQSARRRVVAVAVVAALLIVTGTALGLRTDFLAEQERIDRQAWPPHDPTYLPTNGRVEIARGPDWSIMAWRSAGGICFAIATGSVSNWARGCGASSRDDDDPYTSDYLITMLMTWARAADGKASMAGAVSAEVATVELVLVDGTTVTARTFPAPETVSTIARLFVVRRAFELARPGHADFYRAFVFRDANGRILERFTPQAGAAGG